MNYTVTERNDSREMTSGKNASATLRYLIHGTISATAWVDVTTYALGNVVKRSDGTATEEYISLAGSNVGHDPLTSPTWWQKWSDSGALTALLAAAPATHSGLVKTSGHVNALCVLAVPDSNPTLVLRWEGEVTYAPWDYTPPAVGEERYEFETGGGSQHITQSITRIASYATAGTAVDHQGAIGIGTDNAVEGCDIETSQYRWSITKYFATITDAYKNLLASLTNTVSDAVFEGFAIGEVRLVNVTGSKRGKEDWEMSFHFARNPNKTGVTIGTMTGIAKKGWEYLWVQYKDTPDATAVGMAKRPIAAYVDKVYESGTWTNIYNNAYTV